MAYDSRLKNLEGQAFDDYDCQIAKPTADRNRLKLKHSVRKQDSKEYFGTSKIASNANLPNLNHLVVMSIEEPIMMTKLEKRR